MSRIIKAPKNKFSMKWTYGNYTVRSVDHDWTGETLPYVELTYTNYDERGIAHTIVLATYHWNEDGGDLRFVGSRPFEFIKDIDIQRIWYELWNICEMLDHWYLKEVVEKED
jgi:hypothetical protein